MPDLMPRLRQLETQGLLRRRRVVTRSRAPYVEVDGKRLLAFCSNDYLGLADHPAIVWAAKNGLDTHGTGAGSSALISGHTAAHAALEARLASFMGAPRALYFSTGYMANLGIVPALVGRGDAVFSDERNHACLIDAARLSRADVHIYPHGDIRALARMLADCNGATKLVATDAVFSMDGDLAPLRELLTLCERHDAWLLIDDAHGFGVLGERGRGTLAHLGLASPRVVYLGTLGKAAGVSGAFVAGEESLIEWLVQRARTYVFTTGSAPVLASALIASLDIIERDQWRREHLQALIAHLRAKLAPLPWRLLTSTTAIQPLIVGDNHAAVALMDRLEEHGIWAPAIRPPSVPEGTARLRISLSAAHSFKDIDRLGAALCALASAKRVHAMA